MHNKGITTESKMDNRGVSRNEKEVIDDKTEIEG